MVLLDCYSRVGGVTQSHRAQRMQSTLRWLLLLMLLGMRMLKQLMRMLVAMPTCNADEGIRQKLQFCVNRMMR